MRDSVRCGSLVAWLLVASCATQAKTGDTPAPGEGPRALLISEIMYHPVAENAAVDNHEFVEIHNAGAAAVALAGWKLAGDIAFTFPAGAAIKAGEYKVIAKNRRMLAAIKEYGLSTDDLFGDYDGELDNGKGKLSLLDAGGAVVDAVAYGSRFPWPTATDALGAEGNWLPPELQPEKHQYRGRSLERYDFTVPAAEIANWDVSPLDGATPGKRNSLSGAPPPIVETLAVAPQGNPDAMIRAADKVAVRAGFSARGAVRDAQVEYYVDDVIGGSAPRPAKVALNGTGGSAEAVLPAQKDDSIVRYRILGDRGKGIEVLSPRPSDPFGWYAYHVTPPDTGKSHPYRLFISTRNWGVLWDNMQPGAHGCGVGKGDSCDVCTGNVHWNERVPAVFVDDGKVYDVRARYSGSTIGRIDGLTIPLEKWPYPKPDSGTLKAFTWNLSFPRYDKYRGDRSRVRMAKLAQSCPGFPHRVVGHLFESAGIAAPANQGYGRLFVNGGYYNYVMDLEKQYPDLIKRFYGKQVGGGDVIKSDGISGEQGAASWSDERPLAGNCSFTAKERFQASYLFKTNDWTSHDELIALIEGMSAVRADAAKLRAYLADRFDVKLVLGYLAIMNFAGAWDDNYHNHLFYKRPDGKWMLLPDDLDRFMWGDAAGGRTADRSFYFGREGDPSNQRMGLLWNYTKDAFFRAYKPEYDQALREYYATLFRPEQLSAAIDAVMAEYNQDEAKAAPPGTSCTVTSVAAQMKKYAQDRYENLRKLLGM